MDWLCNKLYNIFTKKVKILRQICNRLYSVSPLKITSIASDELACHYAVELAVRLVDGQKHSESKRWSSGFVIHTAGVADYSWFLL